MQYDEFMNVMSREATIAWDVTAVAVMVPILFRLLYSIIGTFMPKCMGRPNAAKIPLRVRLMDFVRDYMIDLIVFFFLGPACLGCFLVYWAEINGTTISRTRFVS